MSGLGRSLLRHGIKISDRLLPPPESIEEDPPKVGVPDAGNPPQEQTSLPELLPNTLGATLHQFAEGLGIPTEACYLVALCVAASLIPGQTRLVIDPHFGIETRPILWGGLVGDVDRLINTLTRPLKELQVRHSVWYQSLLDEYKAAMRRSDRKATLWDLLGIPEPITLYTSDCTIEAIGLILSRHPERGLLLVPDGLEKLLQAEGDRQSGRGSDPFQWLRLYEGRTLQIDCWDTDTLLVHHPSVSVVGGIQMPVLRALGRRFVELGIDIWSRFAWVRVPFVPDSDTESGPLSRLTDIYHRLQMTPSMRHKLDWEGREIWSKWCQKFIGPVSGKPAEVFRAIRYRSQLRAARIALILHRLDAACAGATPREVIPANTLARGIEFARRLQRQSEAIFSEVCESIGQ
jgi:hypothetical protein